MKNRMNTTSFAMKIVRWIRPPNLNEPMASPAMMTGLILAVARAAGEVAPLMLVGVVKLAPSLPLDGNAVPIVSDFFDFSIYIDAEEALIHKWYVDRFMKLRETAFRDPNSFFHRYSQLSESSALAIAEGLWTNINLKNLRENILPTRPRADLILKKGENHLVEKVALRKL